jgi:hypothetical protein
MLLVSVRQVEGNRKTSLNDIWLLFCPKFERIVTFISKCTVHIFVRRVWKPFWTNRKMCLWCLVSPAPRASRPQRPDGTSGRGSIGQYMSAVLSCTHGLSSSEARWDLGERFYRSVYVSCTFLHPGPLILRGQMVPRGEVL